ncbi:MAG: DUF3052 family protein [Opitutae bacterium]|nr:DUF3052 family protein [Opitutae bacterium]
MGLEANGTLRLGRDAFAGRAHLDSDMIQFRGGARLDLIFKDIKSAEVERGGALVLTHTRGTTTFVLPDRATAERWALKIRYPKSLIDKLGVKPDSRVAVLGVGDPEFLQQATQRLGANPPAKPAALLDFIFYAADSAAQLAKLKSLRAYLQPAGAIWVVTVKGKAATVKDSEVRQAASAAGLVDIKVCGFSATHTALKLVIPKNQRG